MVKGIIGEKFGRWTILEVLNGGKVRCRCDCGVEKVRDKYTITHNKSYSCGCFNREKQKEKSIANNNLKGQSINYWTVLEDNGEETILCRCVCGTEKICNRYHVISGRSKSCGCKRNTYSSLVGKTFNEWTILKELGDGKVLCRCSCGTEKINEKYNIIHARTKSCGCKSAQYKSEALFTDVVGKQFNEWEVLEDLGNRQILCRCSCGEVKVCNKNAVTSGKSKSCGHNTNKFKSLIGKHFGEWEITEELGYGFVECKCSCGTINILKKATLLNGSTKSCGCNKTKLMQNTLIDKYGEITANRIENPRESWQIEAVKTKENLKEFITSRYSDKPTIANLVTDLGIKEAQVGRLLVSYELQSYVNIKPLYSKDEKEVFDFLKSIYSGEIECNNRKVLNGLELDIYIPELKLAIEYNGDYWHSDIFKSRRYHQDKTVSCAKKGIRLIHIFEYEWKNESKQSKIKNYLNNIFNEKDLEKVYARNTEIYTPNKEEVKEFLDKYHLQGYSSNEISIGLKHNDNLIGVMTFGKPRFNNGFEYELIRLCFKDNVQVIGGSEKMFSYFLEKYNPNNIVSYCDISKFKGNVYTKLGFKTGLESITEPSYVWTNTYKHDTLSRYKTQKHKLVNIGWGTLEESEDQIMSKYGYFKVYDAGNLRFEYTK